MFDDLILRIKRGETPFYRALGNTGRSLRSSSLPVPGFTLPILRAAYGVHTSFFLGFRRAASFLYVEPLFRGRCTTMGKRVRISRMPFVLGHARIYIGNDVHFFGKVDVYSGRIFDEPKLIIKDGVGIGHNVNFTVNREIVIEESVNISSGVRFMDSDSHPRDAEERAAGLPPHPAEIRSIRVGRAAWIGQDSLILKGVTIGEGAIIGVNSVVVTDIPPFSVAMGNPARVVVKNINKPATAAPTAEPAA